MYASHLYFGGYPFAELTLLFSLELMQRDNARFYMKPGIPWLAPTAAAQKTAASTEFGAVLNSCKQTSYRAQKRYSALGFCC